MALLGEDAYVTLVMSDSYIPGAAVLAHSLRDAGTTKKLAALITLDTLSAESISELKNLYDYLIPVDRVSNPAPANLYLMGRPDLLFAFTKIALWRQTQFRKIVYLDADVVVLRAPDELFDLKAPFAAAPDVGWPDAFNSGVMVLNPDMGDYWALHTLASSGDSFDGADQGLLNQYFENKNWHRLSFTYNCTPNAQYQWEPAYRYYKSRISMVHFIGKDKPWLRERGSVGASTYNELLSRWWAVFDKHMRKPEPEVDPVHLQQHQPQTHLAPSVAHQQVHGESTHATHSQQTIPQIIEPVPTTTEQPFTDPGEHAENIAQGRTEPTPTAEQRRFSAPQMEWDATRSAPPMDARPEAVHFPTQTYEFSDDSKLFSAPQVYPEPPKDMWYQVPETKPTPQARPKPIFPWERQGEQPQATRVFAEDRAPSPVPEPVSLPAESATGPGKDPSPTKTPTPPREIDSQAFAPTTNQWDTVPGIDRYVRAVQEAQIRRTQPQRPGSSGGLEDLFSPVRGGDKSDRERRRESLILTDFPSAIDRPSLPVTPAPVRRPTFWGEERDSMGELPAAEGVPDQAEWNPSDSLEKLRRSSLLEFEHLNSPDAQKKEAPAREMPPTAAPLPTSPPAASPAGPPSQTTTPAAPVPAPVVPTAAQLEAEVVGGASLQGRPTFKEPDFGVGDEKGEGSLEEQAYLEGEGMMSPMRGAESP